MNTAVSKMMEDIVKNGTHIDFGKYLRMERDQIQDAVIYGLDENSHNGDWKISIAQKYYDEKHLLNS
jgi:hypothetical protein